MKLRVYRFAFSFTDVYSFVCGAVGVSMGADFGEVDPRASTTLTFIKASSGLRMILTYSAASISLRTSLKGMCQ